ncbi:TetR/AcrR family transcriptional regulator [Mycolicibacterium helvum]|uniref:TetR family transcriptional regulator n=1 Tax=Mycolicibacterium helvum TaxID=1534349 RepID=A0A7I7TE26_9MYCO|nr:TetR/AcrR family transcriptional regulator [Mycolicibacterium helvum]BBY66831.1 TetR family transcriptional regulator [Mycolicibacterium helvum]
MARARNADIDDAVLGATLELLAEVGYADLSIGQVATRAGVHRPAVYRRWPSKRHLIVDTVVSELGAAPTPDTGDLRADLIVGITTLAAALGGTTLGAILPALVSDLARSPDLSEDFLRRVFAPRRESTAQTLESARQRGVIRESFDMEFVLDALAAPVYYRVLFRHLPVDAALVAQTVDAVLASLAVAPHAGTS